MNLSLLRLFILSALSLVAGCGSQVVCDVPPPVPLFFVQSVTDGDTRLPIEQVMLSAFTFGGKAVAAAEVFEVDEIYVGINGGYVDTGTTISKNGVLCTAPCTFGYEAQKGMYGFTVSAEGYAPERVTIKSMYKSLPPSQYGSGRGNLVTFDFTLDPE